MGKKLLAATILFLVIYCGIASSQESTRNIRVAVADFEVTSDDANLRYVGKGLAEMISGDLGRIEGITVIDRERRAQALEELEFALSQAPAGTGPDPSKVLPADYILYGKVIDMGGSILVSARLVKVETGEVLWSEEKLDELIAYGELSAAFAIDIAVSQGLDGTAKVAAGRSSGAKGSRKAIVAFSAAVDAIDRGDAAEAKKQIGIASDADSGNATVRALFDKLVAPGPRFRSEIEFYAPLETPAEAALQDSGSIGVWAAANVLGVQSQWGPYRYFDFSVGGRAELSIPVGEFLSIRVEALSGGRMADIYAEDGSIPDAYFGLTVNGGGAGLGVRVADGLSVGLAGLVYDSSAPDGYTHDNRLTGSEYAKLGAVGADYGASISLAYRNPSSTLFAGFQASWSSLPCAYLSVPSLGGAASVEMGCMPLVFEANVIGRVPGKRLFGSLRGIVEQDYDSRSGTFMRLLPGCEYWINDSLTVRASLEVNAYRGLAPFSVGGGGLVGASFMVGGYEVSANLTIDACHSRVIPQVDGSNAPMATLLVGMSWKGFAARKGARR